MLRRFIGWILSIVVVGVAAYNLAWDPELRDKLTNWSALGWLALVFVGLAVSVYFIVKHNRFSLPIGILIGVAILVWGQDVLDGIEFGTILLMLGVVVVLVVLACVTILDRTPSLRRRQSTATASGPQGVAWTPDQQAS